MRNIIIKWAAIVSVALGYVAAAGLDSIGSNQLIETEKLKLHPIKRNDASDIVSILGDPEVTKYFEGGIATSDKRYANSLRLTKDYKGDDQSVVLQYWQDRCGHWENNEKSYVYKLSLNNDSGNSMIGLVGGTIYDDSSKKTSASAIWFLKKEYWRKGLMTEVAAQFFHDLFLLDKGLEKIKVTVHPENIACRALLEKFNFVQSKELVVEKGLSNELDGKVVNFWAGFVTNTYEDKNVESGWNAVRVPRQIYTASPDDISKYITEVMRLKTVKWFYKKYKI